MLASEFNGKVVYASGMKKIGAVQDQIIDPQGFQLTDLVVKVDRESARRIFGKKMLFRSLRIRVPVDSVDKIGDGVILKFGVDALEEHVQKI